MERHIFRPKLSDDELLAIICQLGPEASNASVCDVLAARLGKQVSLEWVRDRLERLERARLLAYSVSQELARRSFSSDTAVRLTALGVERLSALQHESVAPPSE